MSPSESANVFTLTTKKRHFWQKAKSHHLRSHSPPTFTENIEDIPRKPLLGLSNLKNTHLISFAALDMKDSMKHTGPVSPKGFQKRNEDYFSLDNSSYTHEQSQIPQIIITPPISNNSSPSSTPGSQVSPRSILVQPGTPKKKPKTVHFSATPTSEDLIIRIALVEKWQSEGWGEDWLYEFNQQRQRDTNEFTEECEALGWTSNDTTRRDHLDSRSLQLSERGEWTSKRKRETTESASSNCLDAQEQYDIGNDGIGEADEDDDSSDDYGIFRGLAAATQDIADAQPYKFDWSKAASIQDDDVSAEIDPLTIDATSDQGSSPIVEPLTIDPRLTSLEACNPVTKSEIPEKRQQADPTEASGEHTETEASESKANSAPENDETRRDSGEALSSEDINPTHGGSIVM